MVWPSKFSFCPSSWTAASFSFYRRSHALTMFSQASAPRQNWHISSSAACLLKTHLHLCLLTGSSCFQIKWNEWWQQVDKKLIPSPSIFQSSCFALHFMLSLFINRACLINESRAVLLQDNHPQERCSSMHHWYGAYISPVFVVNLINWMASGAQDEMYGTEEKQWQRQS